MLHFDPLWMLWGTRGFLASKQWINSSCSSLPMQPSEQPSIPACVCSGFEPLQPPDVPAAATTHGGISRACSSQQLSGTQLVLCAVTQQPYLTDSMRHGSLCSQDTVSIQLSRRMLTGDNGLYKWERNTKQQSLLSFAAIKVGKSYNCLSACKTLTIGCIYVKPKNNDWKSLYNS